VNKRLVGAFSENLRSEPALFIRLRAPKLHEVGFHFKVLNTTEWYMNLQFLSRTQRTVFPLHMPAGYYCLRPQNR
jgi:hypothetical protein